jgi:hypothetical protein
MRWTQKKRASARPLPAREPKRAGRARSLDQTPRAMQRPAASRGSRTPYHVRRARNVMRARLCPIFAVARRASKPAAASFPIMAASL